MMHRHCASGAASSTRLIVSWSMNSSRDLSTCWGTFNSLKGFWISSLSADGVSEHLPGSFYMRGDGRRLAAFGPELVLPVFRVGAGDGTEGLVLAEILHQQPPGLLNRPGGVELVM